MLEDLPEVESFTRFSFPVDKFVKYQGTAQQESFMFADSSLFRVFSFPLAYGNPTSALTQPNSVAISERIAQKYFGKDNPLGQTLNIRLGDKFEPYEVTAVYENIPSGSTIQTDFFLSMHKQTLGKDKAYMANPDVTLWYVSSFQTYVLLKENAVANRMDKKLASFRA